MHRLTGPNFSSHCPAVYATSFAKWRIPLDYARPHITRLCTKYLQTNNIDVLDWLSLSPDLSPIEHLWDELGHRVYLRDPPPINVNELRNTLLQEWQRIPQGTIRTLIRSMRRCNEVVQARGGHTRY